MRDYIEQRVLALGVYIVEQNATVRQAAKMFGVSSLLKWRVVWYNRYRNEKEGYNIIAPM